MVAALTLGLALTSIGSFEAFAAKSASKTKKTAPKAKAKAQAKATKKRAPVRRARSRRAPAKRTVARQATPEADRIREIQQALAERGYPVEPTGAWGPQSVAALKQFQEDHAINNLSGRGKLDPLTLIALGLGPKREQAHPAQPPPEPPAAPTPNQEGHQP